MRDKNRSDSIRANRANGNRQEAHGSAPAQQNTGDVKDYQGEAEMRSTSEIINIIMQSESVDILNSDVVQGISFADYIDALIKKHGMSKVQLLDGICVERSYGYQIMNGRRMPTRIILLRIAILLHLDLKETQRLLSVGRKEALYPKNRFDAILIFAIGHDYDLHQTEELLVSMGEKPLFGD